MKLNFIRPLVFPLATVILLISLSAAFCGVPQMLNFQGRIVIGGTSFNGAGQFQFALVDGTGANTYWSNDGTSSGGGEPSAVISLTLTNGLYAVLLGDTNLAGMTQPIAPGIFTNADVRLRVWFNDGTHGFEKLAPDQQIVSAGYALVADTAYNFSGNVSSAQLPGNVATTNFVVSQNYVTAAVTNGLATISYVNAATNGFVTAGTTNGLATTNFVTSQSYVTASVTNGLATISYVNTATNGLVTAAVTNGLATTNFVTSQGFVTSAATNGLVTASITNGLATTNFVTSQGYVTTTVTNGLATVGYVNFGTNFVGTNDLAQLNSASNVLAGKIISITNGLATTNFITSQGYVNIKTVWAGILAYQTVNGNQTYYGSPNNSAANAVSSYAEGATSVPVPEGMTLTNLYVIIGTAAGGTGAAYTSTVTILSNGVASPLTVTISGTGTTRTARTFSNTMNSVTVPAGTEIGVKVVTGSSAANSYYAWSFEGR
jgi:hypothetical protein